MDKNLLILFTIIASAIYSHPQNVLKIESGAELKTTGGAVITLHNTSLINDGTINQAAGDGIFRFTGDQPSAISGTSIPTFDVIALAKNSGISLTLQQNINVVSEINFISGLIDLNNNNIDLGADALLIGESEASHITGTGGKIRITKVLNAPSSENPGNLGAIITSGQNMGSVTIGRGHESQTSANGAGNSVLRYFDISPANNTGLSATLRLNYLDAELNGLDENTLVFWKSADNSAWAQQDFTSRSTTSNYVEKTGISDFSRWTLSSINNALPVEFILFNVKCDGGKILINWKTAQEQNSSHFIVERSRDGVQWTDIGNLPAAGNSNTERSYSFTDNNAIQGSFYRIAQYDIDGKVEYTSILRLSCNAREVFKVWPNPFNEMVFVNITVNVGSQAVIKIFDNKGSLIKTQKTTLLQGSNQINIDMKNLAKGIYHLVTEWNGGQMKKAVQVVKQ
jgi:hypothetical protein